MLSFTGVSVITDGENCTTTAVDAGTESGYHLLVVKDYSRTIQEVPNAEGIITGPFMVGGHEWCISYYPNGKPSCDEFISLDLCLEDVVLEEDVKVRCLFSFIDQVEYQNPMDIRATKPKTLSGEVSHYSSPNFIERDALERSTHLKDDCFTIRCDIIVCKHSNTLDVGGTIPNIGQHLDYLLQIKVGADVTFEVNGETFTAHRCVLAARSRVFMAQLFGPMKEGTTSSVIQIKDMDAKVFAALLRFIYTDLFPQMDKEDYMEEKEGQEEKGKKEQEGQDEEEGQGEEEGHEVDVIWLHWLQGLFVAAEKYDLQRLKFLCGEKLAEHIGVSSVASTLVLAEQQQCHTLKEACFNFIQVQSPICLDKLMATDGWEHISTTYPSVLKELVANLVSSNQKKDKKRNRPRK